MVYEKFIPPGLLIARIRVFKITWRFVECFLFRQTLNCGGRMCVCVCGCHFWQLLFIYYFLLMWIGVLPACMSGWGCWVPWNESYRQLWASDCFLIPQSISTHEISNKVLFCFQNTSPPLDISKQNIRGYSQYSESCPVLMRMLDFCSPF